VIAKDIAGTDNHKEDRSLWLLVRFPDRQDIDNHMVMRLPRNAGVSAARRSLKRKAGGRYAADLVLQLPARGAGSVALRSSFIGTIEHLVDAIAREYAVTVLRWARNRASG
jgi:hypothetical protein